MKNKKVLIGTAIVIPTVLSLLFVNSLYGNPVSNLLARQTAGRYINEKYSRLDLNIENVYYNFKLGEYGAFVKSGTSEDTAFSIYFDSFGNVTGDDYDTEVANNFTTWRRLSETLRIKATEMIGSKLDYDFAFASIRFVEDGHGNADLLKLQRDMTLDIHDPPLPLEAYVDIYTDNMSYNKIAEVAKAVEATLKAQNVPISRYSVRLIPLSDKPEHDNRAVSWANAISVDSFPAGRMSEENLPQAMAQFEKDRIASLDKK